MRTLRRCTAHSEAVYSRSNIGCLWYKRSQLLAKRPPPRQVERKRVSVTSGWFNRIRWANGNWVDHKTLNYRNPPVLTTYSTKLPHSPLIGYPTVGTWFLARWSASALRPVMSTVASHIDSLGPVSPVSLTFHFGRKIFRSAPSLRMVKMVTGRNESLRSLSALRGVTLECVLYWSGSDPSLVVMIDFGAEIFRTAPTASSRSVGRWLCAHHAHVIVLEPDRSPVSLSWVKHSASDIGPVSARRK